MKEWDLALRKEDGPLGASFHHIRENTMQFPMCLSLHDASQLRTRGMGNQAYGDVEESLCKVPSDR